MTLDKSGGARNLKQPCQESRYDPLHTLGLLLGEFKFVHGTGVLTEWYENGVKKYELELLKSAQHGAERLYDSDGRLCMTRYYFKNKRVSKKAYDIENRS